MTNLEKKRELVREIIEKALINAISQGFIDYGEKRGDKWCKSQWGRDEYVADTLISWMFDEDGNLAIDRLVNLIIY